MSMRKLIASGLGSLTVASAVSAHTCCAAGDASASTGPGQAPADPAQIKKDVETQAAIVQTVEKMQASNASQNAAQDHYKDVVEHAKAEHQTALDKCELSRGEAQKTCRKGADAAFATAKSEAQKALEARLSGQP